MNTSQAWAGNSQASPAHSGPPLGWAQGRGLRLLGSPSLQPPASCPFTPGEAPLQQQPSIPCFIPTGNRTWRPADPRSESPLRHPSRTLGKSRPLLVVTQGRSNTQATGSGGKRCKRTRAGHLQHRAWHQEDLRAGEHGALIGPFPSMCGHSSVLGALASQSSEHLPELPAVSDKFRLS